MMVEAGDVASFSMTATGNPMPRAHWLPLNSLSADTHNSTDNAMRIEESKKEKENIRKCK